MPVPDTPTSSRLLTLDLVRGVAVLGIVAINIAGFAGPPAATESPSALHPASLADEWAFAALFLLFEGKMRALFSMLFGASMLLFVERAEAARRDGDLLQLRRLFWLLCFGYLHFVLLWWGDILFLYAVAGALALPWRRLPDRALLAIALVVFAAWHGWGMIDSLADHAGGDHSAAAARIAADVKQAHDSFTGRIGDVLRTQAGWPLVVTLYTLGETWPLMLIGMVLYRSGLFAGAWPRPRLRAMAWGGIGIGGLWTLALLAWALPRHFPGWAMGDVLGWWTAPAHLAMALGYAAALVLAAPRLLGTSLGQRLAAAGQVAFSNYLGTTLAMTFLFYGWGIGLFGRLGVPAQCGVVALWWAVMLAWPPFWLARFRQGPLEWVWRSLTELRLLPFRRA